MSKIKKILKSKKGFTLVEVLVSIALLGLVLPLTFELFSLGHKTMVRSARNIESSNEVSYNINSNGRVDGTSGIFTNPDIHNKSGKISYRIYLVTSDNPSGSEIMPLRGNVNVIYSGKQQGDVIYYKYKKS
jgi:prepilin-type N-terminal cleavage/methylation domain-containing protein